MAQIEAGAVVDGRFHLEVQIGQGGMGSVWQAKDQSLDTICAVKFMDPDLLMHANARDEALERFKREAQAAAKLASPNVVQILQHGVWSGIPYIAMEFLVGEDLGKRLSKRGRIPARELYGIMEQVTRALNKAHGLGIVHRDLKPDNIYLVRDEDREIAKVLDFGIAKHASDALQGSKTRTGAMLGTPYYMSPEQAQGLKQIDARSDLWSLAVIVFQCLTGKLPFESEALGDLIVKIVVGAVPIPSQVAPGAVPPGFDAWWVKATQRDPLARFATAKEFFQSLGMALGVTSGDLRSFSGSFVDAAEAGLPSNPSLPTAQFPGSYPGTTPSPYAAHSQTGPGAGRTYGGVSAPTQPLPTNKAPLIIGAAAALTVILGGVGIAALVFRGQSHPEGEHAVASAPDTSASAAPAAASASAPAVDPTAAVTATGAAAQGATVAVPDGTVQATPPPVTAVAKAGGGGKVANGVRPVEPAKPPASAAPAASAKKAHAGGVDPGLGF